MKRKYLLINKWRRLSHTSCECKFATIVLLGRLSGSIRIGDKHWLSGRSAESLFTIIIFCFYHKTFRRIRCKLFKGGCTDGWSIARYCYLSELLSAGCALLIIIFTRADGCVNCSPCGASNQRACDFTFHYRSDFGNFRNRYHLNRFKTSDIRPATPRNTCYHFF